MEGAIPQGSFNFHIGLDGSVQIARSLRSLKADVSGLTQAWKAQEINLKSAGQGTAAAEAKYKGLTESVKSQKLVIGQLKDEQGKLDTSTKKGAESFARLEKQVAQAESKLAGMTAQQKRAKDSMMYYKSGLADAQAQLKKTSESSKAYVDRLKAEGKQNQANSAHLRSLKSEYNQMSTIYAKQVQEMTRMANESGKTSDAYHKQAIRVNEMGTKMASARAEMKHMVSSSVTTSKSIARMKDVSASTGNAIKAGFSKARGAITAVGVAAGTAGMALLSGAKQASTLQKSYTETTNLMVSGGEKQAEVTKNVAQMQKDGAALSMKYGKSQKAIADAYQDLVKRGYTSSQALGVMKTELQGSVASGDDFKDVVSVASSTLEGFGLRAKTTGEMTKNTKMTVNALAYAADMTASGFSDMGVAMSYVSATAKSLKMNVSQTAAAVGVLSNNGVEADKAGTGLRKVLNSLAAPSAKTMKSIGLTSNSFKDAHGNLLPLTKSMEILREHTKNLSTGDKAVVFKSLFGTTGMQAGQILADQSKELDKVTKSTEKAAKSGTYVQTIANKNNKSAQQSLARFKASMTNLEIMLSAKLLPVLSKAADAMTKELAKKSTQKTIKEIANAIGEMAKKLVQFVTYLADHKKEVKAFAITVGGIWATGKIVGFIAKTKEALGLLKLVGKGTKVGGAVSNALGGYTMGGALGSAKAAGGFSQLTTAGKVTNGLAGVGVAIDAGTSIYKAFTSKKMSDKYKNAGKGIGSAMGGGIGLFFGGPLGAAVGAGIGKVVGGWAGKASKSFVDGWNKKGVGKSKPKDFLGKLGYDARNIGDGVASWWKKLQAEDNKATKKRNAQMKKATAALAKGWNGFWGGMGDTFKKTNSTIGKGMGNFGKSIKGGLKTAGNNMAKWSKNTYKSYTKWLHGFEDDMKKLGLVGALKKQFVNMNTAILKRGIKLAKSWSKTWKSITSTTGKWLGSAKKSIGKWGSNVGKWWSGWKKSFSKSWSNGWKQSKKNVADNFDDMKKGIHDFGPNVSKWWKGFHKSFSKSWSSGWKTTGDYFNNTFNSTKKALGSWGSSINKWWKDFSKPFVSGWKTVWGGIGRFFSSIFAGIAKDAKGGLNGVIGFVNGAIGGINGVIHKFGGKKTTISKIKKLATGTGALSGTRRAITAPTLAMLNDGPEADNRELVMKRSGELYMHKGRNVMDILTPGDEVFNASETKMLMGQAGITHYAAGTGFLDWLKKNVGGALNTAKEKVEAIGGFVAHPIKSFETYFANKINIGKVSGTVQKAIGSIMKSSAVKQGQKWWATVWDVIRGAANGGAAGGNWAHTPGAGWKLTSGFGNRGGVSGGYSSHDGNDFSGAKLVHAMHGGTVTRTGGAPSGWGGGSGIGESVVVRGSDGYSVIYQELNGKNNSGAGLKVKKGDTVKTGDPIATLGAAGTHVHVGVTKHPMFSIGGSSTKGWLDITKLKGGSSGGSKSLSGGLVAVVKKQLGSGMFSWIAKHLSPLLAEDDSASGGGDPAGSGVTRWKDDVKKDLKKLHLSTSKSMVSKVLKQIETESGGNAHAMGGDDGLADGKAMGLMQVKPGTFNAYKLSGHGNIMNGYDNLLAGLNYAKHRYGKSLSFLGQGHGYANGGFAAVPSIFGEDGLEAAIPLSAAKSSRGYELLGKTAAAMAARDGGRTASADTDKKLDTLISLMTTLVNSGINETIEAHFHAHLDKKEMAHEMVDPLTIEMNRKNKLAARRKGQIAWS